MDDLTALVNQTFDKARTTLDLSSDEKLARHLGVSNVAIYRWRKGELSRPAKILIPLVAQYFQAIQTEDAPAGQG